MSLLSEFIDVLNAAIQDAGYVPSEFEFDEDEADEPAGAGQYYVRSYITITRTSTGDCNRYHAGHGLDFPMPLSTIYTRGFLAIHRPLARLASQDQTLIWIAARVPTN